MTFVGIFYLLDLIFYATYARKFKDVQEMFEEVPSSLKERKITVEYGSTLFCLQNKNGRLKVFNYYLYLLSQILFQLAFLLFLLFGLDYNVENTSSISEKYWIYFSRSLDQTFPSQGRCDYSSCAAGQRVRVEQLTCQIQINVHLKFIVPFLIVTTFCTCLYGIIYVIYFQVILYDGKCKEKRHCQNCNVHPLHCSRKFKLIQYIKYPIFQMNKIKEVMDVLDVNDIICLIIISRDIQLLYFPFFFENYLSKKNTGATSLNSLIPDLSNL